MQWILQEFEDTRRLGPVLHRLGLPHSWHKVVPFVGNLQPAPVIADPGQVVLFGSYTLWRYAEAQGLRPGVFRIRPFVHEAPWQPHMLNGPDALFLRLDEIPERLPDDGRPWFWRPVEDSKEVPGRVCDSAEIISTARTVLGLSPQEIPRGSLRHDTQMMLTPPARILKEWRVWVVADQVVTWSLYKEGRRVTYRPEIDADALDFAAQLVALNPGYQRAYVMDICRCDAGLRLVKTNCINAAGFYAADLGKLVAAIDALVT